MPADTSQVAMTAATECGFEVIPHPSYSPGPSEFYLFQKLKSNLHGTQFRSSDGVIEALNEYLGRPGKRLLFRRDKQAQIEMD